MLPIENILKHVENIRGFNVPAVVSINRYADDEVGDLETIRDECEAAGVDAAITDFREAGGEGGLELGEKLAEVCSQSPPPQLKPLYPLEMPIKEKVETIARKVYGASGVEFASTAVKVIRQIENLGCSLLEQARMNRLDLGVDQRESAAG